MMIINVDLLFHSQRIFSYLSVSLCKLIVSLGGGWESENFHLYSYLSKTINIQTYIFRYTYAISTIKPIQMKSYTNFV